MTLTESEAIYQRWLPVLGRSLAFLCVQSDSVKDKTLADKALLLEALGLERAETAMMLGTTYASITETLSRVKRSKKGVRGNAKQKKRSQGRKK
jgi:hypothetical protein